MRGFVFRKNTPLKTKITPNLLLPNATPSNQGSKLDKKGFCKDTLTKQTHFSQERLTDIGQETLT